VTIQRERLEISGPGRNCSGCVACQPERAFQKIDSLAKPLHLRLMMYLFGGDPAIFYSFNHSASARYFSHHCKVQ